MYFSELQDAASKIPVNNLVIYIDSVCVCVCVCVCVSFQSCLTLCNPMDRRAWRATVHGILQARILEWVAMPYPGIEPGSPALQADSLPFEPP